MRGDPGGDWERDRAHGPHLARQQLELRPGALLQTTITAGPSGTTNDPTPTLGFASSLAGSSFECKLDTGAYSACTSPKTTARLADGPHIFYVRATKNALTDATRPPATRTFTVKTAAVSRSGSTLTVTAAPGAKDNLVITKPSASTLRIADALIRAPGSTPGRAAHRTATTPPPAPAPDW